MRIEDALYEYLVLFEELSLPGIGTIRLTRNHAVHDIAGKKIYPPSYSYTLLTEEQTPARKLFHWIMEEMNVSEFDAIRLVNDFAYDLKISINDASDVKWDKVGRFSLGNDGLIVFESDVPELFSEEPVAAEKLADENPEYTILSGEKEMSSSEMTETLSQETGKRDVTWLLAWIILIAAIMFIGIYFSQNGFKVSSTGNKTQIKFDKVMKE